MGLNLCLDSRHNPDNQEPANTITEGMVTNEDFDPLNCSAIDTYFIKDVGVKKQLQSSDEREKIYEKMEKIDKYLESHSDKPNTKLWLKKARYHMKLEQFTEALTAVNTAIQKDKFSQIAYYLKAQCLYYLARISESEEVFDTLIGLLKAKNETEDEINNVKLNKANFLSDCFKYDKAIEIFDDLLKDNSKIPNIWYCKGNTLIKTNNFKDAFACFNKAAEIEPNNLNYLIRKAVCLQQINGKSEEIEKILQKIEHNINNKNFDTSRYEIQKIKQAIQDLRQINENDKKLNNILNANFGQGDNILELDITDKVYEGKITTFYKGTFHDKPVGIYKYLIKKDENGDELFEKVKKYCEKFKDEIEAYTSNYINIKTCLYDNRNPDEKYICVVATNYDDKLSNYLLKYSKSITDIKRYNISAQIINGVKSLLTKNATNFHLQMNKIYYLPNTEEKIINVFLSDVGFRSYFLKKDEKTKDFKYLLNELYDVILEVFAKLGEKPEINFESKEFKGMVCNLSDEYFEKLKKFHEHLNEDKEINKELAIEYIKALI